MVVGVTTTPRPETKKAMQEGVLKTRSRWVEGKFLIGPFRHCTQTLDLT